MLILLDKQHEADLLDAVNRSHAASVVIAVRAGPLHNAERTRLQFEMDCCPILIFNPTGDGARAVWPEI